MNIDWDDVLRRLHCYPDGAHMILPACSHDRIAVVEEQLGAMPEALSQMLQHFNGADLFIHGAGGSLVTIFGISMEPLLPMLEWPPEWYIDKFTPRWRSAGSNRELDWAIAMTNYGGLIVLDHRRMAREWDTDAAKWIRGPLTFEAWIEDTLREGAAYLEAD